LHQKNTIEYLSKFDLVFWDFDGVIKESVHIKTAAFEKLFFAYDQKLIAAIKKHHEANCGMSRFEKIPKYLEWVGEDVTNEAVRKYCDSFSANVFNSVIESPWVPGVREWITRNYQDKYFVIVTATPQEEMEQIISALNIDQCFRKVFGAPTKKKLAIQSVLGNTNINIDKCIMIGDSKVDLVAANTNSISFLLRKTPLNMHLQNCYDGPKFDNLDYE